MTNKAKTDVPLSGAQVEAMMYSQMASAILGMLAVLQNRKNPAAVNGGVTRRPNLVFSYGV